MHKLKTHKGLVLMFLLATMLACNLGEPQSTPPPSTQPPATELTAIVDTAPAPPPTETPIQHQNIPVSLPPDRSSHAGDQDSSATASQKMANGGDRFTFERFERPFNGMTMETYFPELDITDTFVYQDDTWVYGTIQVVNRSAANESPFRFAMQVDITLDGKGDWLMIADNPSSTEWTTEGVQVYFDTNGDVGNATPVMTDNNAADGNGFEALVFDQGIGNDPDSAWARVSPLNANIVELAMKRSLMENTPEYMVNMWTGRSCLNPALFDFSDHYTHEQAGAADPEFPFFYPIQAVFELDNTCRMAVGFKPTGNEPGLCQTRVPAGPADPAEPGCQLNDAICAQQGPGYYFDPATCSCYYFG